LRRDFAGAGKRLSALTRSAFESHGEARRVGAGAAKVEAMFAKKRDDFSISGPERRNRRAPANLNRHGCRVAENLNLGTGLSGKKCLPV